MKSSVLPYVLHCRVQIIGEACVFLYLCILNFVSVFVHLYIYLCICVFVYVAIYALHSGVKIIR